MIGCNVFICNQRTGIPYSFHLINIICVSDGVEGGVELIE